MKTKRSESIDFLKGLAIVGVVLYHSSARIVPFGYLGVDIFFVIAGYFMAGSFLKSNPFSYSAFLWNRITRILPLVLIVLIVCLGIGYVVMLPNQLKRFCESVVATSFFANNILACIKTNDYWNAHNEYNPLIHTWYLGVLVQGYVVFPLLWVMCAKFKADKLKAVLYVSILVSCFSLFFYIMPWFSSMVKFYCLPFRAYEILLGAIVAAVLSKKSPTPKLSDALFRISAWGSMSIVALLLFLPVPFVPRIVRLLLMVLFSCVLLFLFADARFEKVLKKGLAHPLAVLGMASFSIYLWHQVELAFGRCCIFETRNIYAVASFVIVLVISSILSYHLIEKKIQFFFSNRKNTIVSSLLLGFVFIITTSFGVLIYCREGVVRDIPELEIRKGQKARENSEEYNSRVYDWDRDFSTDKRKKVLVVGNSYGRDWANVLSESSCADEFEISYIFPYDLEYVSQRYHRFSEADYIFSVFDPEDSYFPSDYDESKVFILGTKSFGSSICIIYLKRFTKDYFEQRVFPKSYYMDEYKMQIARYNREHYIDMISPIIDDEGKVPVFTPAHKMISQDCMHLTKFGAQFYASIFNNDIQRFATGVTVNTPLRKESE